MFIGYLLLFSWFCVHSVLVTFHQIWSNKQLTDPRVLIQQIQAESILIECKASSFVVKVWYAESSA